MTGLLATDQARINDVKQPRRILTLCLIGLGITLLAFQKFELIMPLAFVLLLIWIVFKQPSPEAKKQRNEADHKHRELLAAMKKDKSK